MDSIFNAHTSHQESGEDPGLAGGQLRGQSMSSEGKALTPSPKLQKHKMDTGLWVKCQQVEQKREASVGPQGPWP
jgi:hypothetical protein